MDVSSSTNKLYTRAVSPSVEGHLHQEKEGQGKEITQNHAEHVKNERAAEARSAAQKQADGLKNKRKNKKTNIEFAKCRPKLVK